MGGYPLLRQSGEGENAVEEKTGSDPSRLFVRSAYGGRLPRPEWIGGVRTTSLRARPGRTSQYISLHIPLDIDPITRITLMQRGDGVGVGDNGTGKCCGLTIKDRQTNPINCHRAFLHQVATKSAGIAKV